MNPWVSLFDVTIGTISGAMSTAADRESTRAKMAALKLEKNWNINVMEQNAQDVYSKNILSAFGSGISSTTGSTAAVIANNQRVLQDEIKFRVSQYDTELRNLKAKSKQKYLGLF